MRPESRSLLHIARLRAVRYATSALTLASAAHLSVAHATTRSDVSRAAPTRSAAEPRTFDAAIEAPSRISRFTLWRAGSVHRLHTSVVVENGGTLVIEPGARIEARPGVALEVGRAGRLIAAGTALQPIVFTCISAIKYEGCWDGVTIKGWAPINFGNATSAAARGVGASGCRESEPGAPGFGGCDAADSSGALRYVRIEYASRGLSLLGVGERTPIDFVQVNRSGADGVTVAGGTVGLRHLFLTANTGYGLSWRSGWRGRGQFIAVQQDERGNLGGISGSNEGATPSAITGEPRSAPQLLNVTVISPSLNMDPATAPAAIHFRRGTAGVLQNILIHTAMVALDIDDSRTCQETPGTTRLTLSHVVVANTTHLGSTDVDPLSCEPYASPTVESEWLSDATNVATVVTDPSVSAALIRNATNLIVPDLRTSAAGPAVTNPVVTPPTDNFFDAPAAYAGAVPSNLAGRNEIPWYSGWTTAAPALPLPGTVAGTVSSLIVGPFENALVSSAMGRDVRTSPDGSYSLALPAGEHQLSVSEVPIGCGSSTRNVLVSSSSTTVVNFSVDCTTVTHLAVGALHGCALAATGAAQCWGGNEYGMVGDGTSVSPRLLPVAVTGSVAFQAGSLSSGYTHTCGIRNSRAVCWGLNFFAALGVGTAGLFASEPVAVGTSATPSFTAVSAGGYHGCGLTSAGTAWCWGWNQEGQAGQSSTAPQLLPAAVNAGPLVFAQIAAGESHTCALTTAGAAYCWGGNGRGELGSDPAVVGTSSVVPIAVPGDHVFASIDAGTFHTCGITTVGALLCWGSQEHGQLGNGVVDAGISAPTAVSGGATYRQVSAGGHSTCAVTTADVVHCWGAGVSGVLGNGTNVATQSTPVPVVGALSVAGVAVNLSDPSGATACAFTLTGAAYCWGQGSNGQFGVGTTTSSNVPVQVLIRGPQP